MGYKHVDKDGDKLVLQANTGKVSDHNLYLRMEDELTCESVSVEVKGKAEIERFIYAAAVEGGLIKQGEKLELKSEKTVPADGAYYMGKGDTFCHVLVEGGRVYVPQNKSDVLLDCTDEYLKREDWDLKPMRKMDS